MSDLNNKETSMQTGNIKISGHDDNVALNFSLDMDLTVSNAQKVMVYVIDLKAKELAEANSSDESDA